MKKNKEIWTCRKCGEFDSKADLVKCPVCKSRKVFFIKQKEIENASL